jgi:hypothetical protein
MLRDGTEVFLEDDLLSGRRADDLRKPPEVNLIPVGPACVADVETQEERLESEPGGLQVAGGILTGTAEITDGFVFDPGNIDRGEIAGPHETSQLDSIAAVSLDSISCPPWDERWCDHQALEALLGEVPIESVAAGASFVGEDKLLSLGLQSANHLIDVALTSTDGTEESDLGRSILRGIGYRDEVLVDIQTNEKGGIMLHG